MRLKRVEDKEMKSKRNKERKSKRNKESLMHNQKYHKILYII